MQYKVLCPSCKNELSFIIGRDYKTGEITITVDCEWCDEYHGVMIRTQLTEKDLASFKDKFLEKPRLWIVMLEQ